MGVAPATLRSTFYSAERLLRLAFVGHDLSTLVKSLFGRITLWWLTFFMAGSDLKGIAIQATLAPQHVATVPVATKTLGRIMVGLSLKANASLVIVKSANSLPTKQLFQTNLGNGSLNKTNCSFNLPRLTYSLQKMPLHLTIPNTRNIKAPSLVWPTQQSDIFGLVY